nr:DUF4377 domain-containing protein [Shewanella mangrovi]
MSCSSDSDDTTQQTLKFLSYKQPCVATSQQLCLLAANTSSPTYFYDAIAGFEFVWGHSYELTVDVTTIKNPPADGSSMSYELVNVVSDVEDAVGTAYPYDLVEMMASTITKQGDVYYFLGQPFNCSADADCDGLVAMNNSGGLVNLAFEYAGDGNITLTGWN